MIAKKTKNGWNVILKELDSVMIPMAFVSQVELICRKNGTLYLKIDFNVVIKHYDSWVHFGDEMLKMSQTDFEGIMDIFNSNYDKTGINTVITISNVVNTPTPNMVS